MHGNLGNLDDPVRLSRPPPPPSGGEGVGGGGAGGGGGTSVRGAGVVGSGGAWTDATRSIAVVAKSPPLAGSASTSGKGKAGGGGGGRGEGGGGRGDRPGESAAGRRRRNGGGKGAAAAGARRLQARLEALLRLEFASAMADMLYGLSECLFFLHPERPIFNGARFLQVRYSLAATFFFFLSHGAVFFCYLGREEGRGRGWRARGQEGRRRSVCGVCPCVFVRVRVFVVSPSRTRRAREQAKACKALQALCLHVPESLVYVCCPIVPRVLPVSGRFPRAGPIAVSFTCNLRVACDFELIVVIVVVYVYVFVCFCCLGYLCVLRNGVSMCVYTCARGFLSPLFSHPSL